MIKTHEEYIDKLEKLDYFNDHWAILNDEEIKQAEDLNFQVNQWEEIYFPSKFND